jgi:hypothetical protein
MRAITDEQKQALEDLSAEGLLKNLPVQTAEKDIHITELLLGLSKLKVEHDFFGDLDKRKEDRRHDTGIQLVFAGGTCLSKAHGLIERMSEDIDIKVVLQPPATPLSKGRGDRARLKVLHEHVRQMLDRLGFPLLAHDDGSSNPHVDNQHRYYLVGAGYRSAYDTLPSLRPELKLEIIERSPVLPVERRQFGYLHEALAGIVPTATLSIDCISVAETAAEKVLSLLRRCAYKWDGHQKSGDMDPALVRHVYDVARIAALRPDVLGQARAVFAQLMNRDCDEFRGQNPEFDQDPKGVLVRTLAAARDNGELQQRFTAHLLPLVYGIDRPAFDASFLVFEQVANDFLSAPNNVWQ